jgi:sorbitol-specific phosphotransferase system component IIBC
LKVRKTPPHRGRFGLPPRGRENGMAVVAAVKAGELLLQGALESEASVQKRAPGLQIVVIESNGSQRVAFQPEQRIPMLDVTVPAPEPALQRDADLE